MSGERITNLYNAMDFADIVAQTHDVSWQLGQHSAD
jgi:hypothetical protein